MKGKEALKSKIEVLKGGKKIEGGKGHGRDENDKWSSIPSGGRDLQSNSEGIQFRKDGRNIQDGRGGIPSSQSGIETGESSTRQVWKDEGELLKGTQEDLLHKSKDPRTIDESLTRSGEGSTEDIGDRDSKISKKTWGGVTEELKAQDQMKWVGMMNNIKASIEEIIQKEIIFS